MSHSMTTRIFTTATAGFALPALALSTAAHAADLGGVSPRPGDPMPYSDAGAIWQGLYLGAGAGYGRGKSIHTYQRNDNHGAAEQTVTGGLASLTLGYNVMAVPGILLGVEGDLGVMDLSAGDRVIFDGHVWKAQFGPFWGTLRARAGYTFDRFLVYGTAGLAFMSVNEVGIGDADGQTATNRSGRSGYVLGGGVEYAVAANVSAKVEYLHMDFGTYRGFSDNHEPYAFDNKVDLVRAGLNFRF